MMAVVQAVTEFFRSAHFNETRRIMMTCVKFLLYLLVIALCSPGYAEKDEPWGNGSAIPYFATNLVKVRRIPRPSGR